MRIARSVNDEVAGILVESDEDLQPLALAKMLKAIVEKEEPGIVVLGKQAIDGDNAQVPAMVAEIMGWPQVLVVDDLVAMTSYERFAETMRARRAKAMASALDDMGTALAASRSSHK